MEAGSAGFIQEALRGILKCLGLEGGGGKVVTGGEEVVNNPPPSPSLDPTPYEPLPPAAATTIVDVLSSPVDNTTMTIMDINNLGAQSNFTLVTIDEITDTGGGTTEETHYVELLNSGQPNMNLLATSLISSGGGGETHSEII